MPISSRQRPRSSSSSCFAVGIRRQSSTSSSPKQNPSDKSVTEVRQMSALANKRIAIVGAGSGIGKAIAQRREQSGRPVGALQSVQRQARASGNRLSDAQVLPVDMTDSASVEQWADQLPTIDHLVISASNAAHGPFAELDEGTVRSMFDAKFFGPYRLAKAALNKIDNGGSITFFSGVLSRRPGMNCSGLGSRQRCRRKFVLRTGPGARPTPQGQLCLAWYDPV